MDRDIEVNIHQNHVGWLTIMVISIIMFGCCFAGLLAHRTLLWLLILLLNIVLFGVSVHYARRPTVIWSDGICLYWKHTFKEHMIDLNEISGISCEPYTVRSRYGTYQRIRLTLRVSNYEIGDIEFNDSVNAGDLLNEKLSGTDADIPIIDLYRYLNEHCSK